MGIATLILKFGTVVYRMVKKFDLFSQSIKLTYKGESAFTTFVGGFVSLIIFTIVGIYSLFLLQIMINRKNSNNSKSTEVVNLNTSDENYYPVDYGFAFGVLLTDIYGNPMPLDSRYFTLQISEGTINKTTGNNTLTNLGYKLCDSSDLPGISAEYLERGQNSSMYCPVNKRYRVAGNYLSNNYRYILVMINKCLGSGCMSDADINTKIQQTLVSIGISNSYMDFNDFNTPVKSYLDDRLSFYLQPNYVKYIRMYAKLSKTTLDDDYFRIRSSKQKEFFSIERFQNDVTTHSFSYLNAAIMMDPNRDLYQRTVFSILDLFGTIGGIFGLLTSLCGLVIGMISVQVMLSSVLKRLYFVSSKQNDESMFHKVVEEVKIPHEEEFKISSDNCKRLHSNFNKLKSTSECNSSINNDEIREAYSGDIIKNKLRNILKNRRKYKANCLHKILTFLPLSIIKSKSIQNK